MDRGISVTAIPNDLKRTMRAPLHSEFPLALDLSLVQFHADAGEGW
jgi:hypothetical protein